MSHCFFCTLLCEITDELSGDTSREPLDCQLRSETLHQIQLCVSRFEARVPRIDGKPVSIDDACEAVRRLLSRNHDSPLLVTGSIRTVETSRAVLAFAALNNAILDPLESDPAFAQILATQRSCSMTATFSEVLFRSDCIVIVGDDRVLASMPRLPHLLMRPDSNAAKLQFRRVVLMGNWTQEAVSSFRELGVETQAIQMDPHDFPNAMHTWSRLTSDEREQSVSLPSRWMESADYLAIVWAPSNLCFAGADLWIERLQLWIAGQNTSRRVVGLPLAGNYQSFQQVATWTTGFPGRMRLECDSQGELAVDFQPVRYRKEAVADLSLAPTIIEVNDTGASPSTTKVLSPDILISPTWFPGPAGVDTGKQKVAPKIFIPCSIPGIESLAQYFRADSVYSVKVEPTRSTCLPTISELLKAISPGAQRP